MIRAKVMAKRTERSFMLVASRNDGPMLSGSTETTAAHSQKWLCHGTLFGGLPRSYFTPKEMMRRASGKKIIMSARQATREHIVSHFMRETSYFMCMK